MIFWDTSAVVPLLVEEPASAVARSRLAADGEVAIWWVTPVECASALARLEREGVWASAACDRARARLDAVEAGSYVVQPTDDVREHARRLLRRHPLTAADALQLGAAMTWADARPAGHCFRTLDRRLAAAARGEGFAVEGLPPGADSA